MDRTGWRRAWGGLGTAVVSLAAALGLLVGSRALLAVDFPTVRRLLSLHPDPREGFGLAWSPRAAWPVEIQGAALDGLISLVAGLILAGVAVGLLNCLILLVESGAGRRRELAVRVALGAGPLPLLRVLWDGVRPVVTTAASLGILLGLVLGGLLRVAWPGDLDAVGMVAAFGDLLAPVTGLLAVAVYAYVAVGLRMERQGAVGAQLTSGGRASDDGGAVALRRTLAALQLGGAGTVAVTGFFLASGLSAGPAPASGPGSTGVLEVSAPGTGASWPDVLAALAALPGMEAESLATPGALVGLGVRDYATADCGACVRGGLPLRFIPARADHHAVAPGFFRISGQEILSGRAFDASDGPDAAPVAVVNRTFANSSFEDGEAVGRRLRVGRDLRGWYTVVGVVEDLPTAALGGVDGPQEAVYLSALQRPPTRAVVLVQGADEAVVAAAEFLDASGLRLEGVRSLAAHRAAARAPQRWAARVAAALTLLILGLAAGGVRAVSTQLVRRQEQELAIRRALGADGRRILRHVLLGSLRPALWGTGLTVFFGTLNVGLLRRALGGVPAPGPTVYLGVACLLLVTVVAASWDAARRATRVPPVAALE